MNINEIAQQIHELAKTKGWHNFNEDEGQFIQRATCNLHSEVSELFEAWKTGKLRDECDKADKMRELGLQPLSCIEEEYADILIRALDNCMRLGVDPQKAITIKHAFNASRPYRHGGKLA